MNVKSENITGQNETMTKDTADFSDNPPITEERAQKGWVRLPNGTRIVPVKMDAATFQWFRSQGQSFSQQMETVLRNYAAAQREQQSTPPKSA